MRRYTVQVMVETMVSGEPVSYVEHRYTGTLEEFKTVFHTTYRHHAGRWPIGDEQAEVRLLIDVLNAEFAPKRRFVLCDGQKAAIRSI
jgi:hypothetical protein